jgi:hypothetical protein
MSSVPERGIRTGRSVAVLTYLEKQTRSRNVRDIMNAVGVSECTLMYGTLSTLQRQGRLLVKKVGGNNMFRIAPGALINKRTGARLDQPTTPVKVAAREKAAANRAAKAQATAIQQVKATPAKRTPTATPAPTPRVKAQHSAGLTSRVINTQRLTAANAHGGAYLAAKRIESMQIADDIAEFEAHGGKIQRLGMHETSRPLNGDYRDTFTINGEDRGGFRPHTLRALPANPVEAIDDDSDD